MPKHFRAEQALFGYKEGHNLVAASVALEPRTRQFLADATDGSGPDKSSAFAPGITGLPVPQTQYYGVFCTWPAPEMPRPGCVWSHVILLDHEVLRAIEDLSVIRQLFLRPAKPPFLGDYQRSITIQSEVPPNWSASEGYRHQLQTLIAALYGYPEDGIVVLDDSNARWEKALFDVWSQQWPRMREKFAFSTGSFGDRRLLGEHFDVQIAPLASHRAWNRSGRKTRLLLEPSENSWRSADWVLSASADPLSRARQEFFWRYGDDVKNPRGGFRPLEIEFNHIDSGKPFSGIEKLRNIATAFPDAADALSLKSAYVSDALHSKRDSAHSVLEAIAYLLSPDSGAAYDRVQLSFDGCIEFLWTSKRAELLTILEKSSPSEKKARVTAELAAILTPQDVAKICCERPSVLSSLIAERTEIAAKPEAWPADHDGQRVLWNGVRAATEDPALWTEILATMLSLKCAFAEGETVSLSGDGLMAGLASWLKGGRSQYPSHAWRSALRVGVLQAAKTSQVQPDVLALLSILIPLDCTNVLSAERLDLQRLASRDLSFLPDWLLGRAAFWLFAIGLNSSGRNGEILIRGSFPVVYELVARSEYPNESWELIEPLLPKAAFGWGWDRCRQLRKAVVRWGKQNKISIEPSELASGDMNDTPDE